MSSGTPVAYQPPLHTRLDRINRLLLDALAEARQLPDDPAWQDLAQQIEASQLTLQVAREDNPAPEPPPMLETTPGYVRVMIAREEPPPQKHVKAYVVTREEPPQEE
jgi:hypothetical protein